MIHVISGYGADPTAPAGGSPAPADPGAIPVTASQPVEDLASTMVLRGAVGVLAGGAVAPKGQEAVWAVAGFVVGSTLGEIGIVGLLAASLWKKAGA